MRGTGMDQAALEQERRKFRAPLSKGAGPGLRSTPGKALVRAAASRPRQYGQRRTSRPKESREAGVAPSRLPSSTGSMLSCATPCLGCLEFLKYLYILTKWN